MTVGERGSRGEAGAVVSPAAPCDPSAILAALDETERSALEHLAVSEPVSARLAEDLLGVDVLVALERHGLVTATTDGRRTSIALCDPRSGEAVRDSLPLLRARAVHRALVAALETLPLRRSDDTLRLATWRLRAGLPPRVETLLPAARLARANGDFVLAEELARAAVDAECGCAAAVALAKALQRQGRHEQAEEWFAAAVPEDDAQAVQLAILRATNLFWGLARPDDADALIATAEGAVDERTRRDALTVTRAYFLVTAGHPERARDVVRDVLASPTSSVTRGGALLADAEAAILQGRTTEALETLATLPMDRAGATDLRVQELRWSALFTRGELTTAHELADHEYRSAVERGDTVEQGTWAFYRGIGATYEGRVATAFAHLDEAVRLLRDHDAFRTVACLGAFGIALALSGRAEAAQGAIEQAESYRMSALPVYLSDLALARMWVLVANGGVAAARAVGLDAASRLHREVPRNEVLVLHAVARVGGAALVSDRLREIAVTTDAPLFALCAAHADALARDDGHALDAAAAAFRDAGWRLFAAEAAASAALVHDREALHGRAVASRRVAVACAATCEGARTPALVALDEPHQLTARERELAALAVRGLSSRAIADLVGISVRTVDNHLYRVYGKLGVGSRRELAEVLPPRTGER